MSAGSSGHPSIAGIPLVLGSNIFGKDAHEDASFAILDAFFAAGGRMIDTAQVYSETRSEMILGKWTQSRGVRADVKIATKVNAMGKPGQLAPAYIAAELDKSFDRLRTDYVDLYYAHRDDELTPQGEVAAGFNALVESGKVRELGASNFTAERLASAIDTAESLGMRPYSVIQNEYNLVERAQYEGAMQELCVARGVASMPYYGLAAGLLTGKYRSEADLAQSRRGATVSRYLSRAPGILAAMDAIHGETGASLPAIALAWLRAQPGIAAPIASARAVEQVAPLIEGAQLELTVAQLDSLTAAG